MGGEKMPEILDILRGKGSPPRGRGKELLRRGVEEGVGITPAWAGKSPQTITAKSSSRDHPRVGGEKKLIRKTLLTMLGSPPRGRGKGLCGPLENCAVGITPAWAGKRSLLTTPGRFPWDHPRVGGEKSHAPPAWETNMGSPPRGRGKVMGTVVIGRVEGITPAWAGKSLSTRRVTRMSWDHPRVGGEKELGERKAVNVLGSPPRGRGKASPRAALPAASGITPAWAGKRNVCRPFRDINKDHPRVGGEKSRT